MFKAKTTIVLGAGFSREFNMPLGHDLKSDIATFLSLARNHDKCPASLYAVTGGRELKCLEIERALVFATSIDSLVESRTGDEDFIACAKGAISASILQAEGRSSLALEKGVPDLGRSSETAARVLFDILVSGIKRGEIPAAMENVAVVNFNYDRCFELYLEHALAAYFGIERSEAVRHLTHLRTWHPYGTVGSLPGWPGTANEVPFGQPINQVDLRIASTGIETYSERRRDPKELDPMREWIQGSRHVIFLGAAPHEQNLELLRTPRRGVMMPSMQGWVTCLKAVPPNGPRIPVGEFSAPEGEVFNLELWNWQSQEKARPTIAQALTCHQMASMYAARWSRPWQG